MLKDHIIKIVETESNEFLKVAAKLDGFKMHLIDLKESIKDFQKLFSNEKA
jgi:hypothetical protein